MSDDRVRVRLSVNPSQNEILTTVADALGLEKTTTAMFAFSLGLRALASIAQVNPAVRNFVDQQAQVDAAAVVTDAGLPARR